MRKVLRVSCFGRRRYRRTFDQAELLQLEQLQAPDRFVVKEALGRELRIVGDIQISGCNPP